MTENCNMIPVKNTEAAQWLIETIEKPWGRTKNANYVAAIIPRGFPSYVRLFHPAHFGKEDREVTWFEIAKYSGRKAHPQMQWNAIANFTDYDICLNGLIAPDTGYLPEKKAKVLIEILYEHTNTPENCYFAIWNGWGFPALEKLRNQTARFLLSDRCYYLMSGDIHAAANHISPFSSQNASIWWPQDRTWCVVTEVDMMWTYIGGTKLCIDEILTNSNFEAWQATPDDRADIYGDWINIGSSQ